MSDNKIVKEIAKAIQENFKDFQYENADTFANDLKDYVDSGDIFSCLSKDTIKEILSHVETTKTKDGNNLIK